MNNMNNNKEDIRTAMLEAVEINGKLRKKFNAIVVLIVDGEEWLIDARKDLHNNQEKKKEDKNNPSRSSTSNNGGDGNGDRHHTTTTTTTSPKNNQQQHLQVILTHNVLNDLINQKITPQQAFVQGKLKIKGKMNVALKLKYILDATRKQLLLLHSTMAARL